MFEVFTQFEEGPQGGGRQDHRHPSSTRTGARCKMGWVRVKDVGNLDCWEGKFGICSAKLEMSVYDKVRHLLHLMNGTA